MTDNLNDLIAIVKYDDHDGRREAAVEALYDRVRAVEADAAGLEQQLDNEKSANDRMFGDLQLLRAERDAYKRAKAENDERFMLERDEARADRDRLAATVERVKAIHVKRDEHEPQPVCGYCIKLNGDAMSWPCSTVAALTEGDGQ